MENAGEEGYHKRSDKVSVTEQNSQLTEEQALQKQKRVDDEKTAAGSVSIGTAFDDDVLPPPPSEVARGTSSGLAEEEENENSLTLNHFRRALDQYPEATRFILVEDEENGISIQPRSAATSRLALKKNQAENETIIETLRELFTIRHGGSSEIVDSFLSEQRESDPLTAADLREMLRRSDEAQENLLLTSHKTSRIASPVHTSESEQSSSAAEDSNIKELLGAHIREYIYTGEKITLAEDLSDKKDKAVTDFKKLQKERKAAMRKKREQELAGSVESENEGYMTSGTFLKRTILEKAQAEVATSLLQGSPLLGEGKTLSAAERDVADFVRIAETKKTQAREASLAANKTKKRAATASTQGNFEQEYEAYVRAEEAWNDTTAAYEAAIKKAMRASLETRELAIACDEARANATYWHSAAFEINTKKIESSIPLMSNMEVVQALEIESLWDQALKGYEEAIARAQAAGLTDDIEEWMPSIEKVQT